MSNDEPPLHHFPAVQGMHQTTQPEAADPWELFFGMCWDAWEVVLQRRAAKQRNEQPEAEASVKIA